MQVVLESESGLFFINSEGVLEHFEPSSNNLFVDEVTEIRRNYTFTTYKSIRTLIVPKGVKEFQSDFMRGVKVIERFELPEGLLSIGNNGNSCGKSSTCVFSNCILPEVVVPQSVQEIGDFAFGHSYINVLQLPVTLRSKYGRQFKDSYIKTVKLPNEWKDFVVLRENKTIMFHADNHDCESYGYLNWCTTEVENLEFY